MMPPLAVAVRHHTYPLSQEATQVSPAAGLVQSANAAFVSAGTTHVSGVQVMAPLPVTGVMDPPPLRHVYVTFIPQARHPDGLH